MTDPRIAGRLETPAEDLADRLARLDREAADRAVRLTYLERRRALKVPRAIFWVFTNSIFALAMLWLFDIVGVAPWDRGPAPLTAEDLQVHSVPTITNGDGLEIFEDNSESFALGEWRGTSGPASLFEIQVDQLTTEEVLERAAPTLSIDFPKAGESTPSRRGIYRSQYPDASPEPGHVWSCRVSWTDDVGVARCLDDGGWKEVSLEEAKRAFSISEIFNVQPDDLFELRSIGLDVAPICEWLEGRISDPKMLEAGGDLWSVCQEPAL